jgi:hypothetical protein
MGVILNLVLKPMLEPMTSTAGDITTSLPTAASLPIMAATSGSEALPSLVLAMTSAS